MQHLSQDRQKYDESKRLGSLAESLRPHLLQNILRLGGSIEDAEEILQDALVAIIGEGRIDMSLDEGQIKGYVWRRTLWFTQKWLKERNCLEPRSDLNDVLEKFEGEVRAPEAFYIENEFGQKIEKSLLNSLEQLPLKDAVYCYMRFVLEFKFEQIGQVFGCSKANAHQLNARIRTIFRRTLRSNLFKEGLPAQVAYSYLSEEGVEIGKNVCATGKIAELIARRCIDGGKKNLLEGILRVIREEIDTESSSDLPGSHVAETAMRVIKHGG
jgi:DNA-directed RNA polymerase specialized sigma24 family protein